MHVLYYYNNNYYVCYVCYNYNNNNTFYLGAPFRTPKDTLQGIKQGSQIKIKIKNLNRKTVVVAEVVKTERNRKYDTVKHRVQLK